MNDNAITILARWGLYHAVERFMEDTWEGYYPDIGEYDVQAIEERMFQLLPSDDGIDEFTDAYELLASKAAAVRADES